MEETLNALLDAEADRLCNAQRYERTEARGDTRPGYYERKLHTKAGEVQLKIPKLRRQTFETAIVECYRRRESSPDRDVSRQRLSAETVARQSSSASELAIASPMPRSSTMLLNAVVR
jgi:transposase-like protein